jgi:hypothetical protein
MSPPYKPGDLNGYAHYAGKLASTLRHVIDFGDPTSIRVAAETLREYDAWVQAASERGAA